MYTLTMTEWIVNGNKPAGYEGELTEGQQRIWDQRIAEQNLLPFVPERCRGCQALGMYIFSSLSCDIVANSISKEEAIQRLQSHTQNCTGLQVDRVMADAPDICPVDTNDERNRVPGLR